MRIHQNARLTPKQRQQVQTLYATGQHSQSSLAGQFGTTRKTIAKWVRREQVQDARSTPRTVRRRISKEFEQAVPAYRQDPLTCHHGKVRIAHELKAAHPCSNPSNVYLVLKRLHLSQLRPVRPKSESPLPVGRHRTQMDIQQLPAVEGGSGLEYKISIIHLSTRLQYSEIHGNYESNTIAAVYGRALERLPPFLSPAPTTPCALP
jgi:transposase-like protein